MRDLYLINLPKTLEFYTESEFTQDVWRKSIHVRSAYRNDAMDISYRFLSKTNSLIEELRFKRLSENDRAVASNYDRILNPWVERVSARKQSGETADEIEDYLYGELRDAIGELFRDPQLTLIGLGSPKDGKIFEFNKGTSHGFSYENLASGEKAALDLILDIIVAKKEFNDTVFCIDEPEAHIHTKLQGPLLHQLYKLIPQNSQLWIATHSIGMVRKAQDLWRKDPDSVVFLDFGKDDSGQDRNFDDKVEITPATPSPNLWEQTYEVALGDLAKLVAPKRIILCESKAQDPTKAFDAACYNQIFGSRYPDTRFISIGGEKDVAKADTHLIPVIEAIAAGVKILRLRDRDRATKEDIKNNAKKGIRTLKCGKIEDYLLDEEVLRQLCIHLNKSDEVQEFLDTTNREIQKVKDNPEIHDKRRPIVQRIQQQAEKILALSHSGDTTESFMRDILAPLIQPGMKVYEKLHDDIFGE